MLDDGPAANFITHADLCGIATIGRQTDRRRQVRH
jgi:hypothetical protein